MTARKNQKMIYISDENLDFYESIKDKSDLFNKLLRELRNKDTNTLNSYELELKKLREKNARNSSN